MTATAAEAFAAWNASLGISEGSNLSLDKTDPGNFSASGQLIGSKFGISARSHPGLDIANLTLADAEQIRKREYWDAVRGDEVHPSIAFVLAEAAYGSGPAVARRQMQGLLGAAADGVFGPGTMAALAKAAATPGVLDELLIEFSARRLLFEASLGNWNSAKGGWSRRLFRGLMVARSLAGDVAAPIQVTPPVPPETPPVAPTPPIAVPPGPTPTPTPEPAPVVFDPDTSSDLLNQAELDRIHRSAPDPADTS